jgi:uncharacterized ferritin-like protein (DUF455 family)
MSTLRRRALAVLLTPDPRAKAAAARALVDAHDVGADEALSEPPGVPARPGRPLLVAPSALKARDVRTPLGRATLMHALAHIELNAIDLAADACWRWAGRPEAFYRDWAGVAAEEALHFGLLADRLESLGHAYGDFPAHGALWEMAERTKHDLLARLALVPRTLEARGLDASPAIRAKLAAAGDDEGVRILDVILRDEIGHVAIGNRWYRALCAERGLDPLETYERLAVEHRAPRLRGPFNLEARRAAGFEEDELARLETGT